jgi:hypothetical protein
MSEEKYGCKICHTQDLDKFSSKYLDICKECKRNLKNKPYLCKVCGDSNTLNFIIGRYSRCKKCRNKSTSELEKIKKEEDNFYINYKSNKDIHDAIDNYVKYNKEIFDSKSIFDYMEEMRKNNNELQKELAMVKNQLKDLKIQMNEMTIFQIK